LELYEVGTAIKRLFTLENYMTQDKLNENMKDGFKKLINCGAEIAGGAIGGALGFLAGGPAGATALGAGGSLAAMALKHIGQEASERLLGPREKVRVGGVLAITASTINNRIEKGEKIRSDGFFEEKTKSGRSNAEEVAESVLLKSQREPEEKKIPYMGYLLANVAFATDISAEMAHQLSKASEQLTYRQLCILKLAVVKQAFNLREGDYRGQSSYDHNFQLGRLISIC
jgi:hypothetical protein